MSLGVVTAFFFPFLLLPKCVLFVPQVPVQSHLVIMAFFIRETSLLRMNPVGIYTPTPIQTVLVVRNFFLNLAITNERS